jgi:hypothetical protein
LSERPHAYGRVVITDADLAAAVADREHWSAAGPDCAVYALPGAVVSVRVQRVQNPSHHRETYVASVIRGGTATAVMPAWTAAEAVRIAETIRTR